jgi:hypothetical protein
MSSSFMCCCPLLCPIGGLREAGDVFKEELDEELDEESDSAFDRELETAMLEGGVVAVLLSDRTSSLVKSTL